jgi:hypothetical protein
MPAFSAAMKRAYDENFTNRVLSVRHVSITPSRGWTDHMTDHARLTSDKRKGWPERLPLGYAMGVTGIEPVTSRV